MCDFETTVYSGQQYTEVWAAACTELFSENDNVDIFHSLPELFEHLCSMKSNLICYFHNLKFDGQFWLSFLLKYLDYKPALEENETRDKRRWTEQKYMKNKTFRCTISALVQWYSICIKTNGYYIDIRDSLKLLPFSVKRIGESFKTNHKKLDMEYEGFRYAGCEITDEEKHYIANDVLVVREALEFMFREGHDKLTIGSCCLSEFRSFYGKEIYQSLFPNLYNIEINEELYGSPNAGEYIRKSYRGGWCYLAKGKERRKYKNGSTADVNSLYPSMMSSESGNIYPTGEPTFYKGERPEYMVNWLDKAKKPYFIRIKTRFYIKPGKLPFIQIKNSLRFNSNEALETSDYYDRKTNKYYTQYWFGENKNSIKLHDTRVILTMTMVDYKLLKEHYGLVDFEILDLCYFQHCEIGLFDNYIEKYKKIKLNSKGAMRELAKLFLNNLYGKLASSMDSSFKIPFLREDGSVGFDEVQAKEKEPGYIAIGSLITSYARNFTIRAAQANYHGVNQRGFIYADTDSIHCDLPAEEVKGITIHDKNFCCWKIESSWDEAWFTRQKTYIEHIIIKDGEPLETPEYNIKCAGMPEKCKKLFEKSLLRYEPTKDDKFTEKELGVINKHYNLEDFTIGLVIPGKLIPRRIPGGVVLTDTNYEMR